MAWVEVAPALPVHGSFTYSASDRVQVGHVVLVPFGPRKVTGYVVGHPRDPGTSPGRIRPVDRLLDPDVAFGPEQLRFFRWMARYYRAPLGEVIATALPSAMKAATRQVFRATDEGIEALASKEPDEAEAEVLRELISRPELTRRALKTRLKDLLDGDDADKALDRLVRRELVEGEQQERGGSRSTQRVVHKLSEGPARGRRQEEVLAELTEPTPLSVLVSRHGPYARTAVKALADAGVVAVREEERRDPVVQGEMPAEREPPRLTGAQAAAVEAMLGEPRPWLLHGVTGSGKTEVYLNAAAGILERGRQVLVLVPEIGLTPLLTGRFRARFGDAIAVLHSGLTPAQRLREWRRIRAGEARVAVGARSALFAPFVDLGLIVVDEEHDDSYKQDDGVRYSARDLAVVRGHMAGCAVVLGSATPSLETWHNAREGVYGLLQLLERPTPRPVPEIQLVEMNTQPKDDDGRPPLVSEPVRAALEACFARGDQAIVLYNRRGYATLVQCPDCGGAFDCPSCGVGLVLHQGQRTLSCHYCGFHREQPTGCPACGGALEILGRGTERIEETLRELFPTIPMERMDADTTSARGAHFEILERFRGGHTRLLVGTQIVAKGHDFPDVSCAVVLGADHILRMPDFRSAERCFALVTQLAGRAGRGENPGQVLLQSHQGGHYAFQLLGDFDAFAEHELRSRHLLLYPPFSRLAMLRIEAPVRQVAWDTAWELRRRLRAVADGDRIQVLGPAMAALPKLVGRYRVQLLLRGTDKHEFRAWLDGVDLSLPKGAKGVRVAVDVDPRHLM